MRFAVSILFSLFGAMAFGGADYCTDCGGYGTAFGPEPEQNIYYCFVTITGTKVEAHKFYGTLSGLSDKQQCLKKRARSCSGSRYKHWTTVRPNPCSR